MEDLIDDFCDMSRDTQKELVDDLAESLDINMALAVRGVFHADSIRA